MAKIGDKVYRVECFLVEKLDETVCTKVVWELFLGPGRCCLLWARVKDKVRHVSYFCSNFM